MSRTRATGFTLIEVVGAFFMTVLILFFAFARKIIDSIGYSGSK